MKSLRKLASISEKNKNKIRWNEIPQAKEAFYSTKALKANKSKHFFYTEDAPIFLLTDASDYGIGGYLYQLVDGKEQPVAVVSKSLIDPQLKL